MTPVTWAASSERRCEEVAEDDADLVDGERSGGW